MQLQMQEQEGYTVFTLHESCSNSKWKKDH